MMPYEAALGDLFFLTARGGTTHSFLSLKHLLLVSGKSIKTSKSVIQTLRIDLIEHQVAEYI
jgi:hypothetical protein